MAGKNDVPRLKDLRTDLASVNEQLTDLSQKMANVVELGNSFKINTGSADDLAQKFSSIIKVYSKLGNALHERERGERDLSKTLSETARKMDQTEKRQKTALDSYDKLLAKIEKKKAAGLKVSEKELKVLEKREKNGQKLGDQLKELSKEYKLQEDELDKIDGKWTVIAKVIANDVLGAVDKMTSALLALGVDSVFLSFKLIKDGVYKIYDLMQRTVKVTGEFNEGLGGTTTSLRALQKEGWQLEGALRGLSDAGLGIGLKELKDATTAFGFANQELSKFRVTAVLVGKAFGLGSAAAGEMARTFKLLGTNSGDVAKAFVEVSDAANSAGVPVADFAKEINGSKNFLASFGRMGRKVFLDSAGFAKRLGLSLSSLQKFTEMTDTFEKTAESAAKMNTVFGTSINALELMLEQDPSKRLEMVRRSFKDQGKTFEGMSRQERKFFAQTMQLTEEEAAAVLESGLTLDEYNKKKIKQARTEAQAQKDIQKGLLKTVSTLNNWGLTFDNVTRSFMPLLKDLTDFLGITTKIDEKTGGIAVDWKSFSSRVGDVVGRIRVFFKMMGENDQVKELISTITNDFKGLFNAFTAKGPDADRNMKKLVDTIGSAAGIARSFYDTGKMIFEKVITKENVEMGLSVFRFLADNIGKITIGLLAVKGALGAMTVIQGLSAVVNILGGAGGFMAAIKALGGLLTSPAGLVVGVGALSYGLTRLISRVTGFDDVMVRFFEKISATGDKVSSFFSDVSTSLKESALGKAIFGEGHSFDDTRRELEKRGFGSQTVELLAKQIQAAARGRGGDIARVDDVRQNARLFGEYLNMSESEIIKLLDAQHARYKGAAVPHAVTPSTVQSPASTMSSMGPVSSAPTNFATKPTKGKTISGDVKIVAGDVYLDGNLVGRHLGRLAYEG